MEIMRTTASEVYNDVLWYFRVPPSYHLETVHTRNGKAKVLKEPLTICTRKIQHRLILDEQRNANPFFHIMEAIWMMAGQDSDWIVKFNKNMENFISQDWDVDLTPYFHGAYGYRWMHHFNMDQVQACIEQLKEDPGSRRAYISMWDPRADLTPTPDLPCNVGISLQMKGGCLDMYVFNRSNDVIWGMLGSNIVHFSMLQEVIADCLGVPFGKLYQMSANAHIYERHWPLLEFPHESQLLPPMLPLMTSSWTDWKTDCQMFVKMGPNAEFLHKWFDEVARPMYLAYTERNQQYVDQIKCSATREACNQWWERNRRGK